MPVTKQLRKDFIKEELTLEEIVLLRISFIAESGGIMKNNKRNKVTDWAIKFPRLLILGLIFLVTGCTIEQPAEFKYGTGSPNQPQSPSSPDNRTEVIFDAEIIISDTVIACEPVNLEFILTNQSDETVNVLTMYTPLEGIRGDLFSIAMDGKELSYLGPMVSRGDPGPEQFILIQGGESVTAIVDLSEMYDFSNPGVYTIEYRSPFVHFVPQETNFPIAIGEISGFADILRQQVSVEIIHPEEGNECPNHKP